MARRSSLDFSQVDPSSLDSPSEPLSTGIALVEFTDAPAHKVDVTGLPFQRIVRPMLSAVLHRTKAGGPTRRPDSIRGYERVIGLFAVHLEEHGRLPADASVKDLTDEHLNSFEDRLRSTHPPDSRTPAVHVNKVVVLLRRVAATVSLDGRLLNRLMFSVTGDWGEDRPVEPYGEEVISVLLAETRKQCLEITREFPLRLKDLPPHPAVATALEEIGARGFLDKEAKQKLARDVSNAYVPVHNAVYPVKADLRPFLVRLALLTGWEPAVLAELKADCIREESGGYVLVKLTKYRRHSQPHTVEWIKDGNLDTPGGVIRAVLKLTAPVRRWHNSPSLWVAFTSNGKGPFRAMNMAVAASEWINSTEIDDGSNERLVELKLRRIRKSFKQREYLDSRGDLKAFARGHSLTVAARHYADTEANRELHESTVEAALDDVIDVASRSRITTPNDAELSAPDGSGLVPGAAGASNHWVCKCIDHLTSPYIEKGKPCDVGLLMCLSCPNSKISVDNLPSLLALSSFLEGQAEALNETEWHERYGQPWVWIHRDILPQFSAHQIESARATSQESPITAFLALLEGVNSSA